MAALYLSALTLSHFRSHRRTVLETDGRPVAIYGPNGAGKTILLEAVSLFSPGRGMRRAALEDIQCKIQGNIQDEIQGRPGQQVLEIPANHANDSQYIDSQNKVGPDQSVVPLAPDPMDSIDTMSGRQAPWAVSALIKDRIQGQERENRLGTGVDPQGGKKRLIRINGETVSSQAALGQHLSVFWLTPQMDRLFIDPASERRRFLDRMIISLDPAHTGRTGRYEKAMSQRSKLLRDGVRDDRWLNALEAQMAETGVALAATRKDFVARLAACTQRFVHPDFPQSDLCLNGFLEDQLDNLPALELEERFQHALCHSREADSYTGGAAIGPHRSDFTLIYRAKKMVAGQCSTGEQKILLTALVLAHARLVAVERGLPPLLLLDEVTAHLDENRRHSLFQILRDIGGQVWLTGTDKSLFSGLDARYFMVSDGALQSV